MMFFENSQINPFLVSTNPIIIELVTVFGLNQRPLFHFQKLIEKVHILTNGDEHILDIFMQMPQELLKVLRGLTPDKPVQIVHELEMRLFELIQTIDVNLYEILNIEPDAPLINQIQSAIQAIYQNAIDVIVDRHIECFHNLPRFICSASRI